MSEFIVGNVMVATTSNRGHDAAFYAESLTKRLISVAESTPEPIRAQALSYESSIRTLSYHLIRSAIRSDRTTITAALLDAGLGEAAALIGTLEF